MALGAPRRDVLRLVVGQGMTLVGVGLALGLLAAYGLTRFLSGLIFGVSSTDPVTFFGIALFTTAVGLMACLIPASRATRIDPIVALRCE